MTISALLWFFILTVTLSAFIDKSKLKTKTTAYGAYARATRVPIASIRNQVRRIQ
jgi:hypothetical protein